MEECAANANPTSICFQKMAVPSPNACLAPTPHNTRKPLRPMEQAFVNYVARLFPFVISALTTLQTAQLVRRTPIYGMETTIADLKSVQNVFQTLSTSKTVWYIEKKKIIKKKKLNFFFPFKTSKLNLSNNHKGNQCKTCFSKISNCIECDRTGNSCSKCARNYFRFSTANDSVYDQCLSCTDPTNYAIIPTSNGTGIYI